MRAVQAKLSALKRGVSRLSLTLAGQPTLQAEGKIHLTDIRNPINGDWRIQRLIHQLDEQGFTTQVEAEIATD